jgi:hypothetical protein
MSAEAPTPSSSEAKGFEKTYNDKIWTIKAILINMITNTADTLMSENIIGIQILNSLDNFTPSISFIYKDSEYHISKHLQNFACTIRVNYSIA